MEETLDTKVRIALPLPADVVSTIQTAVGTAYPHTEMLLGTGTEVVLVVKDSDRDARVRAGVDFEVEPKGRGVDEPELASVDSTGVTLRSKAGLNAWLVENLGAVLDEEGAPNYLETEFRSGGQGYVVVLARSAEQTPHALREAAEERRRVAEHEASELRRRVTELEEALSQR
jgi:hypothetical protein